MMGRQTGDQSQLFYLFNLERGIPAGHLLRRINPIVTRILMALREKLAPFYSEIGRPSIDPELMLRMLIVGYCYGIRFERRLCEEVEPPISQSWRRTPADITARLPMRSTGRHGRHEQLPSSLPGSIHRGARRKCGCVNGIKLGDPFKIALVKQFNPFCIYCFNLGFLCDRRCDKCYQERNHQCSFTHYELLLFRLDMCASRCFSLMSAIGVKADIRSRMDPVRV
jgi:hypothetical protein